jgi:hypothetical protein
MASDYGLNFGFRRSDESMATREGRFKTPAAGSALLQGSAVQLDPAEPGYLKQCAADAPPVTGLTGLLVQEEGHIPDLFNQVLMNGHDSYDLGACKLDQLSVMWAGVGTKVWFRNTAAYSRGGRTKAAVTVVNVASVAIGDPLIWDGSKWVKGDGTPAAWLTVTAVSGTAATAGAYVEAVVTF